MYSTLKKQTLLLLDPKEGDTTWDRFINSLIVSLIILNALAVILETVDWLYLRYKLAFDIIEIFSVAIFSIEYILRVWSCTSIAKYKHPVIGRLKYILSFGAMIDLLVILPFFIRFDLRFLRLLRLVRFFKLSRYMNASRLIANVFKAKKEELILSMAITLILIIPCFKFNVSCRT